MKKRGARLGQHFLTGLWAAKRLAEAVRVHPGESILEIGPGKGALTRELLALGAHVLAIEKDTALVEELKKTFAQEIARGQLTIVCGDARNFVPEDRPYVVAANIPYYITGVIIRQFLETDVQPRAMALLVQKEVAERILARDGKESILSLSVKAFGTPSIVAKVSRGNFSPSPSVDSAILLIDNISRDFFLGLDADAFFATVRAGFSSKRKTLAGNLKKKFGRVPEGLPEKVRAEDVPLNVWKKITQALSSQ